MFLSRRHRLQVIPGALVIAALTGCASVGGQQPVPDVLPVELDADLDGIADAADLCPETTLATGVDDDGCSPFNGVLEGVAFPPGGTQLGSEARSALSELVDAMLAHPEVRVEVQGHTDNRGAAPDNLELSKRRVMAVVRYLVTAGVAPDRLDPIAFGESRPRERNATPEGREANRRIEVRGAAP